ncbi:MAG: hypothetical protein Q7J34_03290 [Bacteroidales bacterium]|jgi:hypothetical protein|nr:hypothetical protein [Bacteroidales bacterium]
MKIIISGYFDTGFSIGIDDHTFFQQSEIISLLSHELQLNLQLDQPTENFGFSDEEQIYIPPLEGENQIHIGLNVPIGKGLLLDFKNSSITKLLLDEALISAQNPDFMGKYYQEFPPEISEIIKNFTDNTGINTFYCRLYGLGIGYYYLETNDLPPHLSGYALWIYRCIEYASYGTYCAAKFRKAFNNNIYRIYSAFDKKNIFRKITRRKIPYDFFPGFQCILLSADAAQTNHALEILKDYDELTHFRMDDGDVHFGWAAAVVKANNTEYVSRILELMKMTQVYFGICDGFERLFSYHISESVRDSMDNKSSATYDAVSLNRLRTISHTVAEFTRFDSLSQNISDMKLLNHFDELGGFSKKIEHMSNACEIFTSIMNEKIEQSQNRREKRLNMYAMALTALTIVSVLADMLNISEFSDNRGWGLITRIGLILVVGVSAIYFILEGKGYFKNRINKSEMPKK